MRLAMFVCASVQFGVCAPWRACLQGRRRMKVLVFVSDEDRCVICKEEIRKAGPMLCWEGGLRMLGNCSGGRRMYKGKGSTGFVMTWLGAEMCA